MTKITQGSLLSPTPLPRLVLSLAFTITLSFVLFLLLASRTFSPLVIPGPRPSQLFPQMEPWVLGVAALYSAPSPSPLDENQGAPSLGEGNRAHSGPDSRSPPSFWASS